MSSPFQTTSKKKKANRILVSWLVLFAIIITSISVNVFFVALAGVHVHSNTDVVSIANQVYIKEEPLVAPRGSILDKNGNVLAQDVVSYKLIAFLSETRVGPNNTPAYVVDKEETARLLSELLPISKESLITYFEKNLYQTEIGTAGRNLSLSKKQEIEALKLPGIAFETTISRTYPMGVFASYLLGFSQYEPNTRLSSGKMGVELLFNETLNGINGTRRFQTDISGFIYRDMFYQEEPAIHGDSIVLTLDKGIQETLELSFEQTISRFKATQVFGAVMEVHTGKILAWGQTPGFDPNLLNINDYTNVISQANIEPGSTMKTFVYAAAMDTNNYDGSVTYPSAVFHMGIRNGLPIKVNTAKEATSSVYNFGRRDFGVVDLDYAYMRSLNTAIGYILTNNISPRVYEEYLDRFGFFKPVKTPGVLESTGQKAFTYPIEMITTGYGQGSSVTTLQLLQAYTAVFGDGTMIQPAILEAMIDGSTHVAYYSHTPTIVGQPISEKTAKQLQALMLRTATEDGSARFYGINEAQIIAKTGTAQISVPGGYDTKNNMYSIMAALPAHDPQVMVFYSFVAPFSDRAHIDTDAQKNLFRKIALTYNMMQNEPDTQELQTTDVTHVALPNVLNATVASLTQFAQQHNLRTIIIGQGESIIDSNVIGLDSIMSHSVLILKTNQPLTLMPDLIGLSLKDVKAFARLADMDIETTGVGWANSQCLKPGSLIEAMEVCEISFSLSP